MEKAPVVFLGASVCAIAAALERPEDTVILERGALLGPEWIASLQMKPHAFGILRTNRGKALAAELLERGLLDAKGRYDLPPVSFVLADQLLKRAADIRLLTEVVSIIEGPDGLEITLHDQDGLSTLFASRVIDTRSLSHPDRAGRAGHLCALMIPGKEPQGPLPEGALLSGPSPDIRALKLPVPDPGDPHGRKAAFHAGWQRLRSGALAGWQVAHLAQAPAVDFEEKNIFCRLSARQAWMPSASYDDLLSAFDGGVLCASAIW